MSSSASSRRRGPRGFETLLAVAAPLAVLAISAALWLISDRAGSIGPLDRASFGWTVLVPLWLLAPLTAALAAVRLSTRGARRALLATAAILGVSVAVGVGTSLTASVEACPTGPRGTELIGPVALVAGIGAALGLALGAASAQRSLRAGGAMRALLRGAAADLVVLAVTVPVVSPSILTIGCQRPPPS